MWHVIRCLSVCFSLTGHLDTRLTFEIHRPSGVTGRLLRVIDCHYLRDALASRHCLIRRVRLRMAEESYRPSLFSALKA